MKEMSEKEKEDAVQRVTEFLGVKYMNNAGTGVSVSEKWREKHEGRMGNVGVCRGEEREEREEEKERKPTPREESGGLGIGEGWGW